jgi:carboxymethylenebutenolidase
MGEPVEPRTLTAEQQRLSDLWEEHVRDEFVTRDTPATLDTMVADVYVNHTPVMTGGVGREALGEFYSRHFIPRMLPGLRPTGPRLEVPLVVIVHFRDGKLAHEHI